MAFEAVSTAYVVCQYFGLDTSDYSFPYIAGWSSDMEMRELRASMDTIRRTAGELIDQMVERMREIQREAQRQSETALFESWEDRYGIYQLADEGNGQAYRFMGMTYLQERGLTVDGVDYRFVYGDVLEEGESLESLYRKFNMEHPQDYTGHSLSVSDVVIIKKDGELTAHYVDSFDYQELPDFTRQRQAYLEEGETARNYPSLYLSSLTYAMEHGNVDAYLDSRKLNLDCRRAIEEAVGANFDGYHLKSDAAVGVVDTYGPERVSYVLACTVQHLENDGRFSRDTKEWASSFAIPENVSRGVDHNGDYVVSSHPAVLERFIRLAREEIGSREKEAEKETEQVDKDTSGLFVEGHFGTWHTAETREIKEHPFSGWSMIPTEIRWPALSSMKRENWWRKIWNTGLMRALLKLSRKKIRCPFSNHFMWSMTLMESRQKGNISILNDWRTPWKPITACRTICQSRSAWKVMKRNRPE